MCVLDLRLLCSEIYLCHNSQISCSQDPILDAYYAHFCADTGLVCVYMGPLCVRTCVRALNAIQCMHTHTYVCVCECVCVCMCMCVCVEMHIMKEQQTATRWQTHNYLHNHT